MYYITTMCEKKKNFNLKHINSREHRRGNTKIGESRENGNTGHLRR